MVRVLGAPADLRLPGSQVVCAPHSCPRGKDSQGTLTPRETSTASTMKTCVLFEVVEGLQVEILGTVCGRLSSVSGCSRRHLPSPGRSKMCCSPEQRCVALAPCLQAL
jgi:hypothetical protein